MIYRLDGVERQTGGLHGLSQALSAANGPTLLVVADTDGCRMGGFASVAWNLSPRYQVRTRSRIPPHPYTYARTALLSAFESSLSLIHI